MHISGEGFPFKTCILNTFTLLMTEVAQPGSYNMNRHWVSYGSSELQVRKMLLCIRSSF